MSRGPRRALAAGAFAAAAGCFGLGLAGRSGSWLLAMVASLVFLTIGFFILSGSSGGD